MKDPFSLKCVCCCFGVEAKLLRLALTFHYYKHLHTNLCVEWSWRAISSCLAILEAAKLFQSSCSTLHFLQQCMSSNCSTYLSTHSICYYELNYLYTLTLERHLLISDFLWDQLRWWFIFVCLFNAAGLSQVSGKLRLPIFRNEELGT